MRLGRRRCRQNFAAREDGLQHKNYLPHSRLQRVSTMDGVLGEEDDDGYRVQYFYQV